MSYEPNRRAENVSDFITEQVFDSEKVIKQEGNEFFPVGM